MTSMSSDDRPIISNGPITILLLSEENDPARDDIVAAWREYLNSLGKEYQLIVSDTVGNCLVNEPTPVSSLPLESPSVPAVNPGPGAALRAGIAAARHPLLFYALCSKEFQPHDLGLLLEHIDKVDLVTGYRVRGPLPWWLVWSNWLYRFSLRLLLGMPQEPRRCWLGWRGFGRRWLARWVFGVRVADPECPFRLIRRDIFARFPIQSAGSFVHIEILAKANFLGSWIREVPVTWLPAAQHALGAGDPANTRKDIMQLFRHPSFSAAPERPRPEAAAPLFNNID